MGLVMAHHPVTGALPDINPDSEAFETFLRPTHLLPIQASSQPPLLHLETGSVLEVSTVSAAGPNPEHLTYGSTVYDHAYHGRDDYRYRWEVSASTGAYSHGARAPGYPPSPALPQPPPIYGQRGTLDQSIPRFRVYGTIYTDDARMKLGDSIRRQCFNCRATETKTWRRSKLSLGKLVCNKCGLFERAHDVPRPKSLPPRCRSRLASAHQSWNPSPDIEGRHRYNDVSSITPFADPPLYTFSSREGDERTSQDAAPWMTQNNMTDVSSVCSPVSPGNTDNSVPTIYHADLQLPSPYPLHQYAASHYPGDCFYPM